MLERPGVWIEGPGYEVTYGASRQVCDQRCIGSTRCVMVEYYRPERKCNHYETVRPTRSGGASNVSLKTSGPAPTAAGRPDAEPVRRLAR